MRARGVAAASRGRPWLRASGRSAHAKANAACAKLSAFSKHGLLLARAAGRSTHSLRPSACDRRPATGGLQARGVAAASRGRPWLRASGRSPQAKRMQAHPARRYSSAGCLTSEVARSSLGVLRLAETSKPQQAGACLRPMKARGGGAGTCARIAGWCSACRGTMMVAAWFAKAADACCASPQPVSRPRRCWPSQSKSPPWQLSQCPLTPPERCLTHSEASAGYANDAAPNPKARRPGVRLGSSKTLDVPSQTGMSAAPCNGC